MSTRARWAIVEVGLVVVVAVTLIVLNTQAGVRVEHGPHTWAVQPGSTLSLLPSDTHPGDEFICPGADRVVGTPEPGQHILGPGGLVIVSLPDGTVQAVCEPRSA